MQLIITEVRKVRGGGVVLQLQVGDKFRSGQFTTSRAIDPAAKHLGLNSDWLHARCLQGAGTYEIPDAEAKVVVEREPLKIFVRGLTEKRNDEAQQFESFESALDCRTIMAAEPLIVWDGTDRLCALDVDFHHEPDYEKRPGLDRLNGAFGAVAPAPKWCWVTHGRGFRFMYETMGGFDANELAAVAAVRIAQLEPLATVELKSATRHPRYPNVLGRLCSEVQVRIPSTDCRAIAGWSEGREGVDSAAIETWLDEHDYEKGGRYEHNKCPVDPTRESHGTPVVIYENGIYCYGCAGHGVRRGTKAAGWFPYEVFLGHPSASIISRCVENLTHWEHARFILQAHHSLPEPILRGAYGAMCKERYPNDLRLASVFNAGQDVVRFHKRWGTLEGETFNNTSAQPILAKLPGCQYVEPAQGQRKAQIKVDAEKVARFVQTTSLERQGYPHLKPVWGIPIGGHWLPSRYKYEIALFKGPGRMPRYVPSAQRSSILEAWNMIQQGFPGVDRRAVELLIAAKGCVEMDGTWPPFIFIYGPTSSSKTASTLLAAAIAGDSVHSVPCISDDQRIRAAIAAAKESGTYCVFNEAVKDGLRRKIGKAEAMEFALGLTADSLSWKNYVGPIEMGTLPVLIWTDTFIPQEVKEHAQLARRIISVHLAGKVDWHTSMRESSIGKAEWLRMAPDTKFIDAADTILSDVIDRFFKAPMTFEEIANRLGFYTLERSDEAAIQTAEMKAFFDLVQACPNKRDGWSVFDINGSSSLSQTWRDLADPDKRSSQRCQEIDWSELLELPPKSVKCRIIARRERMFILFEGVPHGDRVRHRDAECSRSAEDRLKEVHLPSFDSLDDDGLQDAETDTPVGMDAACPE